MRFAWFRWRLLLACLAIGLLLPVFLVAEALLRARELDAVDRVASVYLRQATFRADTLTALGLGAAGTTLVCYLTAIALLYMIHARGNRRAA